MIAFSSGLSAVEDWRNGFHKQEVQQRQKTHCSHEQEHWHWRCWRPSFFSQADAPTPKTHRTVRNFEHKDDIIASLTFPY